MTPRERVAEASRRFGESNLAVWCADLLKEQVAPDDPDQPPMEWIGGEHWLALVANGLTSDPRNAYWPRVWAARALMYAWSPAAAPAVVSALDDPAWRVREMAAKVVRLREIGEAAEALAGLVADEVPRVRAAAVRALAVVGEGEHADLIRDAMDDPEADVRKAAVSAIEMLSRRLERPL